MSLVLLKRIDSIFEFVDTRGLNSNIECELKILNCKDLEEQAKQIDKENYSQDCFGMEFNYVAEEDTFYVIGTNNIYYIDNNGRKNYLKCKNEDRYARNIQRQLEVEFAKFVKDKEKYSKENNIDWSII